MCRIRRLIYSSKTMPPHIIPCPEAGVFSSFPASLDAQVAKHEEANRPVCGSCASGQCGDREGCLVWAFSFDVGAYKKGFGEACLIDVGQSIQSTFDAHSKLFLMKHQKKLHLGPFGQTSNPFNQPLRFITS